MTGLPPVSFEALGDSPAGVWRRPRRFGFADRIGIVPVSDSEFLQTSLYLPLAVRESAGGCEVVAIIHSALLGRPVVRADGRWLPFYMPIALRCLPFRNVDKSMQKPGGLEIATDLDSDGDGSVVPFLAEDGRAHPEFAGVTSLLDRLATGQARLARAAASLLAADLLVKLTSRRPDAALPSGLDLLVVDPARVRRLTNSRTAALAMDGSLALELAMSCCFSARLWAGHVGPESSGDSDKEAATSQPMLLDDRMNGSLAIELRIDDSALFSFDAFIKGDERRVDPG
jgi:hypothetical protein